jgi:WD40 repeat protein
MEMTPKFIEIGSGQNLPPKKFEIVEVQNDIFMLKTKESHAGLLKTLDKWLKTYYSIGESLYSAMLRDRSSSIRQVLSEGITSDFNVDQMDMTESRVDVNNILDQSVWDDDSIRQLVLGPSRNQEEMKEQADLADSLFVGGYRKLMQWSVSNEEVVKDYGVIMDGYIESMVKTSDKKYLFVSDNDGSWIQIDVKEQKAVKVYHDIHGGIKSIAISSDDKYLFTIDYEDSGHVKQFLMSDGQMIKDYGPISEKGIASITITPDNKYLFAGSNTGHLKQVCLELREVVHDYEEIHRGYIRCLETTRDSKWLITGGGDGDVKRISVQSRKVDKDLGQVCDNWIITMKITADDEKLFVGDDGGHLKLISLRDGEVIKAFGKIHYNWINGIVITKNQKFFFTSSGDGVLKQWNFEDNTLVRDHGKIINYIDSMCL